MGLEQQVTLAPTGVLRVMAGVCALAAHMSGRAADVLSSQGISLTIDSIHGEAPDKHKSIFKIPF